MARGKANKADQRRQKAHGLDRETFEGFIATVKDARQELDDANMAHAGAWKKADALGIHPGAAKLFCKLDKMEDAKRSDFLRSFDHYRKWVDWDAQPDLWDDQPANAPPATDAEQDDGGDADEHEPGLDLTESTPRKPTPLPDTDTVLQEQEEEDPVDDTPAEATEELTNGGYTFAAGRSTAMSGNGADFNPHPKGTPSHDMWARGHAQGLADKAAEDEAGEQDDDSADEAPSTRRGRSRRASAASASVH